MMTVPEDLHFFADTHEWLRLEADGTATIGVSDFAQQALGDIVHASLPSVGQQVRLGEACCVLESVKTASDVYAPITGKIIAINERLASTPEEINDAPYGSGWLFKINPTEAIDSSRFLSHDAYLAQAS
jgi:glycine cleavage system H protein